MTIREFIQLSILKPNKIWTILQNPLKKIKGIFFLLVLLVSIPGFIRAGKDIASMNTNLGIVAKQFPDLSIQDGKLSAGDNTGFVYRSDVFAFILFFSVFGIRFVTFFFISIWKWSRCLMGGVLLVAYCLLGGFTWQRKSSREQKFT